MINIKITRFIWMVLVTILLVSSARAQCYRVYVTLHADFDFYKLYGSNQATVNNLLTGFFNRAKTIYNDQVDVELRLANIRIYKSYQEDPFDVAGAMINPLGVIDKAASDFPTFGGRNILTQSPYDRSIGFVVDLNFIFAGKPFGDQSFGLARGGNLFTTGAWAIGTGQEWYYVDEGQGTEQKIVKRADEAIEATFIHEMGHLFGPPDEFNCRPATIMCQGAGATPGVFSQAAKDIINRNLQLLHEDNVISTGSAEPFSGQGGQRLTYTNNQSYLSVGTLTVSNIELQTTEPEGQVLLGSSQAVKILGTTGIMPGGSGYFVIITDTRFQNYCTSPSARINYGAEEFLQEGGETFTDRKSFNVHPNPGSNVINIDFTLREASPLKLMIQETTGRTTVDLTDETLLEAGSHTRQVDVASLPTGVYVIKLESRYDRRVVKFVRQ